MRAKPTAREELLATADLIERFVSGASGPREWDDFTSLRHRNPSVEALSREVNAVVDAFPRTRPTEWCSEEGRQRLLEIATRVRSEQQ
jgi:hypothetical protein